MPRLRAGGHGPMGGGAGPAPGGAERDELTALQSIFGGDLRRGDAPGWWALRVQPHPGELEANHVACELSFRYPDAGYPEVPPRFRLDQVAGAERGELPRWLERVEAEAAAAVAQGSVCVFDAASLLQELLQEANEPEEEPASLWEDMQQRERERPGGVETAASSGPDFSGFRCEPPMLDEAPLDAAGGGGRARGGQGVRAGRGLGGPGRGPAGDGRPTRFSLDGVDARPAFAGGLGEEASSSESESYFSEASSTAEELSEMVTEVRKGFQKAGAAFPQMLPRWLKEHLRGRGGAPDGLGASGGAWAEGPPARKEAGSELGEVQNRRELLIGHLLRATNVPLQAFPTLVEHLQEQKLLSQWVSWSLVHKPSIFEFAFNRVFSSEKKRGWEASVNEALSQFWTASPSHSSGGSSRYVFDFQEVRALGRGGFGKVALCRNRLDGRLYAVKKVELPSDSPHAYSKILREVSALSRLTHSHIVRYFQAWTEVEKGRVGTSGKAPGDSESLGSSVEEASPPGRAGKEAREKQVLYIQMEYCPRTLQEIVALGVLTEDDKWRVFRQICLGLVHIHSASTIHRDLKPNNIFFDARADIKLGDFGLAKEMAAADDGDEDVSDGDGGGSAGCSTGGLGGEGGKDSLGKGGRTGAVGTLLYASPEVVQGWASYDAKVDVYSLGIVLFEIWAAPFGTYMERVMLLQKLRSGEDPAQLRPDLPTSVSSLVRWLTQDSPSDRPTAREILASELLPIVVENEHVDSLLRSVSSGEAPDLFQKVMHAVFERDAGSERGGDAKKLAEAADEKIEVIGELQRIFRVHGAEGMLSDTVQRASPEASGEEERRAQAFEVVSSRGDRLRLRSDLRGQFLQWSLEGRTGNAALSVLKRFEIAPVYKPGAGDAPTAHWLADFNILLQGCEDHEEAVLAQGECLKVVSEVLERLNIRFEIRVGHRALLHALARTHSLSVQKMQAALTLLSAAFRMSPTDLLGRQTVWPSIQKGLTGLGFSRGTIEKLRLLVSPSQERLREPASLAGIFASSADGSGAEEQAPLAELESLTSLAAALGVGERLVLEPLTPPPEAYFDGMVFYVYALEQDGSTSLLAYGGQFDRALLPAAAARGGGGGGGIGGGGGGASLLVHPACGVGVTFNVDRLVRRRTGAAGVVAPQRVLVAGKGGGGMLQERMALLGELWAHGVPAETVYAPSPTLHAYYGFARERGIRTLVILEHALLASRGVVVVKDLGRKTESEVGLAGVAQWLLASGGPDAHWGARGGGGGGGAGDFASAGEPPGSPGPADRDPAARPEHPSGRRARKSHLKAAREAGA